MKKLLSLPPNLVDCFHEVAGVSREEYFCTCDPLDRRLGSGGGTIWLLDQAQCTERCIMLHAGGQSRRLPAYAPSGKVLTPIPVFRWERGQRLSQNLLSLQLPLYERIMRLAPESLRCLVASGDVYIRASKLQPVPEADVVCYGLWADPSLASAHGVYCMRRDDPSRLDFMLQKPSPERLGTLRQTHYYLMDIGIWLLSERAIALLRRRSTAPDGSLQAYDLYGEFGCALGLHPTLHDEELRELSVAILPLEGGEFYHYGTSREMISSTVQTQNLVLDQRAIMQLGVKPHPSIFTQNAHVDMPFTPSMRDLWIENAWIGPRWRLTQRNIVTGVPRNDWALTLPEGVCLDVVPVGETDYAVRMYGFDDTFRGRLSDERTLYLGRPVREWLTEHGLPVSDADLQEAKLFPLFHTVEEAGAWLTGGAPLAGHTLLSADELMCRANLRRLEAQRRLFRRENLAELASNHRRSVFYQLNLDDAARAFYEGDVAMPAPLSDDEPLLKRVSDYMFRSRLHALRGQTEEAQRHETAAFALLRDTAIRNLLNRRPEPRCAVYADQIVWARSPVRIDIAGGWTDTPPYCLTCGGSVVNLAIELNGQPPLQAYARPCREPKIILHSIDLGATEHITTYEQLLDCRRVGSPFSIPKAALCLAGFHPRYGLKAYASLEQQLRDIGCGVELTLLSAVPAGSGMGTSSILAATVLSALSDFFALGWDKTAICNRTIVIEQLLTSGGGWQDQYGGVFGGIKLLRTQSGFDQTPEVRYLPDALYTAPEYRPLHLLYYTGLTRTAKHILADIVRSMFLYDTATLRLLGEMKEHAANLYAALLQGDFASLGRLVGKSWQQNKALDKGTCPPEVQRIIKEVEDLCLGLKLPGAGGGGYLYMVAKDAEAAARIRRRLTDLRPNAGARLVEMNMSHKGLQVSRS